jgi:ADP-ribose pyrophosphatase YjhB (NUDIX family)
MRYSGSLGKEEREKIFELFLTQKRLKFNEIEKVLGIRSNMVSYHLDIMQKEGFLVKQGDFYALTPEAERYIPLFEHMTGTELSPLPVVLVSVVYKNKILLMRRNKRPYQGYWALLGGKILLEESLEQASLRVVKEKSSLAGKFISTNALLHEQLENNGTVKHSFIIFFTKVIVGNNNATENHTGKLSWFSLPEIDPAHVIPSDYWLINNKLNSTFSITLGKIHEEDETIVSSQFTSNLYSKG